MHAFVALTVVLLHVASPAQQVNGPGQGASANAGAKQQSHEPPGALPASAAAAIQSSLERIAAAQVAQANGGKSDEEKQREKKDLEAQQDMAFWAKAMFIATLASAAVSAGATWLLFLTLKQSRRATFAALRAAAAGRQSVSVAKQSTEQQLRAYLVVNLIRIGTDPENFSTVEVNIKNFGHVPATHVTYWLDIRPGPIGHEGEIGMRQPIRKVGVLAPGDVHRISCKIPGFDDSGWNEIQHGRLALYVTGAVSYHNGFVGGRKTRFKFMRTGRDWRSSGEAMEICDDGNDIT